ncbi:uncharacterized protein EV154DRAFT_438043 [Mucor mucedo]|uniref:uncharacterized protein n=1 Tax=Mucor mucedo TaxID=29922 RepID=UPI0022201856|nr:uncharacterized protein EV154DRAFT_438043 [Mucor mucedo]KAI7894590.1 hypothetical protein EV154DRAFT_438043 [Mucor mucedo]
MYSESEAAPKHWSIRQANSRLHAYGLQTALENDLNRKVQDEEKNVHHGLAIPLTELNSSSEATFASATNPYLAGASEIQQPSRTPAHRSLRHKTYGFQDPFAVAPMEAWQEIKDYNLRVNGLPTLDQMMRLHTYSPLTQSNFAAFLRRRNVHQNLNFLMELETHDKLWRAYLQSIDRQNRQRLSRFLESAAEKEQNKQPMSPIVATHSYVETPDTDDLLTPLPPQPTTPITPNTPRSLNDGYASRSTDKSLNRHDLVQNATRIYRTYCSPLMDAAQTIHLPDDHRRALEELIEINERPEPIVFDSARAHVFEILNVFYYPLFVDSVLYKNISIGFSRLLLAFGIIILTLALSIEFSLIFLDAGHSWLPLIPFFFGWTMLITSLTEFAWFFGIFSICEIQLFVYSDIQDVTVKKLHRKRAWLWLAAIIVLSIVSTLIFIFIPSHRL